MASHSVPSSDLKSPRIPQMLLLDRHCKGPLDASEVTRMNSLLSKVRDFLPQMAEANEKLAKEQTESSGIDIANVVESDSDSDLSADEISENAEKSEQAEERTRIEIDLSVFEEASSSEVRRSESDSSSASESDDELPKAFQKNAINDKKMSKGGNGKSSTRKLIEEIQSSDMSSSVLK